MEFADSESCAVGSRTRRPRLYAKSFDPSDWMGLTSSLSSDELVDRRNTVPCRLDEGSPRRIRFEMPEFNPELYLRTAATCLGNESETVGRPMDVSLGYESGIEHIDTDDEGCMREDSESVSSISSKCCDRCSGSYVGFGSTCPACRRLPRRGSASGCSACGAFFNGFGDTCEDCRFPSSECPRAQTDGCDRSYICGYLGAGSLRRRATSQN